MFLYSDLVVQSQFLWNSTIEKLETIGFGKHEMFAMFVICYVNSRDHMRKELFDLMVENSSPFVAALLILLVTDLVAEEIERF